MADEDHTKAGLLKRRQLLVCLVLVTMIFAVTALLVIPSRIAHNRTEIAKDRLHELQMAIETFSFNHDGSFPEVPEEVVREGIVSELPENPFTGQPMRRLYPGEPLTPGDFFYFPFRYEGWTLDYYGYELMVVGGVKDKTAPPFLSFSGYELGGGEEYGVVMHLGHSVPPEMQGFSLPEGEDSATD